MKKFTTIAAALMLGSFGFAATAQTTTIVPTVDPEPGTVTAAVDNFYVSWGNETLTINPDAPGYEDWGWTANFDVSLYINGIEYTEDVTIGTIDEGKLQVYFTGSNSVFGTPPTEIKYVIPAGAINVGSDVNAELEVVYNVEAIDASPITAGVPFTATSNTNWIYEMTKDYADIELKSNSKVDLIAAGTLKFLVNGTDLSMFWTAEAGEDGYYTYSNQIYSPLVISYTGAESVQFTLLDLTQGSEDGDFMDEAVALEWEIDLNDPYNSVALTWGETVYVTETEGLKITVTNADGMLIGVLDPLYINLEPAGSNEPGIFSLDPGDSGEIMRILTGPSGLFTAEGMYIINLPEGLVQNAEGYVNPTQEIWVQATQAVLAEGTVSPENGTFAEGQNVVLTVTFDGVVVANPESENLVLVTNYGDYDKWLELGEMLKIDGKSIVISLGNELTAGTYEVSVMEGAFLVDGNPNAMIVANFTVGGQSSESSYLSAPEITPADESKLIGWPQDIMITWNEALKAVGELNVSVAYNNGEPQTVLAELWSNDFDPGVSPMAEDVEVQSSLIINWQDVAFTNGLMNVGNYTITVPAGLVQNEAGLGNQQLVLTYDLYNKAGWDVIEPNPFEMDENYNTVSYPASELSAVKVIFNDKLSAVTPAPAVKVLLQNNDGDDDYNQGIEELADAINNGVLDPSLVKVEGNAIVLDLSSLENGDWFVSIPAGFAMTNETTYTEAVEFTISVRNDLGYPELIGGMNADAMYSAENAPEYALLTWNYQAIELTGEGTITAEIEDQATGEITPIEIEVALRHAVPAQEGGEAAPLADEDNGEADGEEADNALEIMFGEVLRSITAPSYVGINIPAGYVTNGVLSNEQIYISAIVIPVYQGEPVIVAEEGEVSILWAGYNVTATGDVENAYVSGASLEENIELTYDYEGNAEVSPLEGMVDGEEVPSGLLVDLNKLELEDGNYTLWIPTGYVQIAALDEESVWYNKTVYWSFDVVDGNITGATSGIESIGSAVPAIEGVYNLQGVKMSNDLNTLAPGLYIINGKKVLIRK